MKEEAQQGGQSSVDLENCENGNDNCSPDHQRLLAIGRLAWLT